MKYFSLENREKMCKWPASNVVIDISELLNFSLCKTYGRLNHFESTGLVRSVLPYISGLHSCRHSY